MIQESIALNIYTTRIQTELTGSQHDTSVGYALWTTKGLASPVVVARALSLYPQTGQTQMISLHDGMHGMISEQHHRGHSNYAALCEEPDD